MRSLIFALCVSLGLLSACGDDDGPLDAAMDTSSSDAGDDAEAVDAGGDAQADADAQDGAMDAESDAGDDAMADSGVMECVDSTLRLESPLPQMTNGSGDDYNPSGACVAGLATGPDRIYALVPVEGAGTYRVTVTPVAGDWNPMIYVVTDCSGETCLDGTNLNGVGEADSLDIDIEADQVLYVVVDTALDGNIEGGPYMLTTEKLD